MAKRRYKPSVRALCQLGTLAHNRQFTTREIGEYSGLSSADAAKLTRWLKKHGLAKHVTNSIPRGALYPTTKGWNMIEKACGIRRK